MSSPRTWLITGASSGFGREVTKHLLDHGERVAAMARHPERLDDLAGNEMLWRAPLDVTDTATLRDVVERAFAELGQIDVVLSNAGLGAVGAAEELSDGQIEEQIAVNMLAPIQLARAVLPHLRAQGSGRIIQMSTMGGQWTGPGASLYHASKWGVEGFFESLAAEVEPFGIGVTIVEPGASRTGFGTALSVAEPLSAYADTAVGQIHAAVAGGDIVAQAPGDPAKIAAAIVDSVDVSPAPLRLTLGSDAYGLVHGALAGRLASLEDARELSMSTDVE